MKKLYAQREHAETVVFQEKTKSSNYRHRWRKILSLWHILYLQQDHRRKCQNNKELKRNSP